MGVGVRGGEWVDGLRREKKKKKIGEVRGS